MRCCQCPKPAIYQVTNQNIPLCIDCWHKWEHGNYMNFQNAGDDEPSCG